MNSVYCGMHCIYVGYIRPNSSTAEEWQHQEVLLGIFIVAHEESTIDCISIQVDRMVPFNAFSDGYGSVWPCKLLRALALSNIHHDQLIDCVCICMFDRCLIDVFACLINYVCICKSSRKLGSTFQSFCNYIKSDHSKLIAVNIITQRQIMDRQKLLHSTDRPP